MFYREDYEMGQNGFVILYICKLSIEVKRFTCEKEKKKKRNDEKNKTN